MEECWGERVRQGTFSGCGLGRMGGGGSKQVKTIRVAPGGPRRAVGDGGFVGVAPVEPAEHGGDGAERLVLEDDEVSAAAPVALPPGWAQEVSRSTGETYYRNDETGETQWEPPVANVAPLPAGWTAVESSDTGQTYYVCSHTGELTFDRPTGAAGGGAAQDDLIQQLEGTERTVARCAAAIDRLALVQSEASQLDAAPVFMAAAEGSSEAIAAVCAADPSCVGAKHPLNGATALHVASLHGHTQCVDELLSWGADPCCGDNSAQTALHYAADMDEVLYALLSSSTARLAVNIEAEPGRVTPLHYSSFHGNIGGMSCLVDYGADVDGADDDGSTALHVAAFNGKRKAVKLLLQYGASLKLRDSQGRTPYEVADLAGHEKVCKTLHHAERKADAKSGPMPTVQEAEEEEEGDGIGGAEDLGDDAWVERKIEEDIDTEHIQTSQISSKSVFQVQAMYDYASDEPGDLEFGAGQIIDVSSTDDPGGGWWTGMFENASGPLTGIFPSNFVQTITGGDDASMDAAAAATAKQFGMGGTSKVAYQEEFEVMEREIVGAQTQIAEWQSRAKAAEAELERQRTSMNTTRDAQSTSTASDAAMQELHRQLEQSRVKMLEERTEKAAELAALQQLLQESRSSQVADQGVSAEVASLSQQRADELAASQHKVADMEKKVATLELELSREREQRNSGAATATQLQKKLDSTVAELSSCREELDRLRKETTDAVKSQAAVATQLKQKQDRIDALTQTAHNAEAMAEAQTARIKNLDMQYKKEWALRKKYYNELQDSKGNIRVYSRLRPLLKFEKERGDTVIVDTPDNQSIRVRTNADNLDGHSAVSYKTFSYNASFNPKNSQEDVFADAKDLVQSTIDGYNVCIFAYGQTGSGKTFTMYGTKDQPGMAPRTVDEIWSLIARDRTERGFEFTVKVYMAEL